MRHIKAFAAVALATAVMLSVTAAVAFGTIGHYWKDESPRHTLTASSCKITHSSVFPPAVIAHVPVAAGKTRCSMEFFASDIPGCPSGGYWIYWDVNLHIRMSTPPGQVLVCGSDQVSGAEVIRIVLHSHRKHNRVEITDVAIDYCKTAVDCLAT